MANAASSGAVSMVSVNFLVTLVFMMVRVLFFGRFG